MFELIKYIVEDVAFIAVGFAGCAVLAHYRPSVFAKIETVTGNAVDKAGETYSKAEDTVKTVVK